MFLFKLLEIISVVKFRLRKKPTDFSIFFLINREAIKQFTTTSQAWATTVYYPKSVLDEEII